MLKFLKKTYFKTISIVLTFIFFNCILSSIYATSNYFQRQTKSVIKIEDTETLQQAWLASQPKLKRYDLNIISKRDIPKLMELFNVNGVWLYRPDTVGPGYNPPSYKQVGVVSFKNPPKGLLGVFLKPRTNPFN